MRVCDLRQKEVINVNDCKNLGCVIDIDFEPKDGCICAIIVPGPCKCFGLLGMEFEYVIPWCKIIRIGPDIVLVDICEKDVKHKI